MCIAYCLLNRLVLVFMLYLLVAPGPMNAKPIRKDPPWPIQCPVVQGVMPCDLI
jgi:hypothetical protein